jgi:hypothetical protein
MKFEELKEEHLVEIIKLTNFKNNLFIQNI